MRTLRSGQIELDLLPEVGGRAHALRVDGADLLRTPADPAVHAREPLTWGSYPMVPWCNRIPDGLLRFEGEVHPQPLTLDTFAIHGRALAAPWTDLGDGVLEFADPGWTWPYSARQEFSVRDDGVSLRVSMRNEGHARMPAGLGIHPWFAGPLRVQLPAELVYPSTGNIPTGPPEPVRGRTDLRALTAPAPGIDECWTGLTERTIGLERADGIHLAFAFSDAADHVLLAAIPGLGAVAIEPQTHAVDAHRAATIGVLEPGETLAVTYDLRVT